MSHLGETQVVQSKPGYLSTVRTKDRLNYRLYQELENCDLLMRVEEGSMSKIGLFKESAIVV